MDWKDTWISLLPKIATPTLPRHLRPLGISEISGRAVCGLIQSQLRPYVHAYLEAHPQFAYLANRSTDQALLRVMRHCLDGQAYCEPLKYATSGAQPSRSEKKRTGGSIQISLDLSQAFDRLEWALIREALTQAAVPSELYELIVWWHRALYYHLRSAMLLPRLTFAGV